MCPVYLPAAMTLSYYRAALCHIIAKRQSVHIGQQLQLMCKVWFTLPAKWVKRGASGSQSWKDISSIVKHFACQYVLHVLQLLVQMLAFVIHPCLQDTPFPFSCTCQAKLDMVHNLNDLAAGNIHCHSLTTM